MKSVLTIAGSDPSGGAGLQADLKVFRAFGLHGLSVVAALTAQSTVGVARVLPVERDFLDEQLEVLLADIRPEALKTGLLYTSWAVELTAEKVRRHELRNLVIDPVTVSSSGACLVSDGTLDRMREELFPFARVITPNIYEASVLTGLNVEDEDGMEKAALALKAMGPEVIIITGGHLKNMTTDLFYDGETLQRLGSPKLHGEYHGTGCAFSAALAAALAQGDTPHQAALKAKDFVTSAIRNAYNPGRGMGILSL